MIIAGVDEVGRGPLAGPVTAAALIFTKNSIIGVQDSKLLTPKKRELLYDRIMADNSIIWALGEASVEEIDEVNIFQATFLAMQRAVMNLSIQPDLVRVDGKFCPALPYRTEAHIKGDQNFPEISAASIVAKVTRDRQMELLDAQYPGFGFKNHKGYGTAQHLAALKKLGPTPIHRRSFAPVRACLV